MQKSVIILLAVLLLAAASIHTWFTWNAPAGDLAGPGPALQVSAAVGEDVPGPDIPLGFDLLVPVLVNGAVHVSLDRDVSGPVVEGLQVLRVGWQARQEEELISLRIQVLGALDPVRPVERAVLRLKLLGMEGGGTGPLAVFLADEAGEVGDVPAAVLETLPRIGEWLSLDVTEAVNTWITAWIDSGAPEGSRPELELVVMPGAPFVRSGSVSLGSSDDPDPARRPHLLIRRTP